MAVAVARGLCALRGVSGGGGGGGDGRALGILFLAVPASSPHRLSALGDEYRLAHGKA